MPAIKKCKQEAKNAQTAHSQNKDKKYTKLMETIFMSFKFFKKSYEREPSSNDDLQNRPRCVCVCACVRACVRACVYEGSDEKGSE